MSTPNPAEERIDAVVYKGGIIRRAWRFKFVARNGRKFGHQYNDEHTAIEAVRKLIKPHVPVVLITEHEDGTRTEHGRIR